MHYVCVLWQTGMWEVSYSNGKYENSGLEKKVLLSACYANAMCTCYSQLKINGIEMIITINENKRIFTSTKL